MAGADISVIYEVRCHLSTCTVSCSRTLERRNVEHTGVTVQAGRRSVIEVSQPAAPTTCEPTEPGLMNGVLPFLFCL